MTNIEKLNADIKKFPQVFPVTSEMNKTFEGVQRLIMLDRYAFKDTKKETLSIGDLVVLTVKQDPNFPARGIGEVVEINDAEVTVRLEEVYQQYAETEDGRLKAPISAVDKPLELYYEQIAKRNAKGLASVEDASKRAEVEQAFYEQLSDLKFVPGGRVLYGAGADIDVTFFNCFTADTIVQTEEGAIPIGELSGNVSVLSKDGVYREAFFKSYGEQEIYEVEFSNGEKIKTTAGHEWYYNTKNGLKKTTTINLEGKNVPVEKKSKVLSESELVEGIRHGIIYGDGGLTSDKTSSEVRLFGEKEEFVKYFSGEKINSHKDGKYVRISKLPVYYKSLPKENSSESYWHGFIIGLIGTDGFVDSRGSFGLHSSNLEELKEIARNLYKTNFTFSSIKMTREVSPFSGEISPCYKLQLHKQSATTDDFIKESHKNNFMESTSNIKKASLKVIKVASLGYVEEVFCCNEKETHTFVIGSGILTANCYVMPFPQDSREGIGKHRNQVMEIMSRGGGVGTNGSTLRPRNALARGVNGKSSGSVSWLNDIAQLTHLVEQGGSRRGAQMIMLNVWHPDILEFIISKVQNPNILRKLIAEAEDEEIRKLAQNKLKFTPLLKEEKDIFVEVESEFRNSSLEGQSFLNYARQKLKDGGTYSVHNPDFLSGANISVGITDDFMQAVENDKEFPLQFPDIENYGEYDMALYDDHWHEIGDIREWSKRGAAIKTYRTIKAKALWDLINLCATYSAEPGIFFIDAANKATNAQAYGQQVVCTNPCGEQPLAPYSVCNLAAINLAKFANKETKEVDYEALKETVRVGVRMQDNTISVTPYFLPENEKQALGERRVGMGVMGLADLLIYCEAEYGSEKGNAIVDKVFETIATEAYRTSIELAKEKGEFPFMYEGGPNSRIEFIYSGFMQNMPEDIREDVIKYGIRNSHLLTVAPTGSTGSMVGVATGLEPYFAFKYYRSGRLGKFMEVNADIVQEYLDANEDADPNNLPHWFKSAMELSPEQHVDVQCIIQRWVDSSLSKTVNAPKGYTPKQVAKVYEGLFAGGAKGGTVYVDGSRDTQVLTLDKEDNNVNDTRVVELDTIAELRSTTTTKIGNEIGNTCPVCQLGKVIDRGGCMTCDNCDTQLKCGL